jgi:hypothetical protein
MIDIWSVLKIARLVLVALAIMGIGVLISPVIMGNPTFVHLSNTEIDGREVTYLDDQYALDFQTMACKFAAAHDYGGSYKCEEYSRDFKEVSTQLGYKVAKICGCPFPRNNTNGNYTLCHCWNRWTVDVEPQQCSFTDYSKDYPFQWEEEK